MLTLAGILSAGQLEDPVCDTPVFQRHVLVQNSSTAESSEVPDSSAAEKISRRTDSFPSLSRFKFYLSGWREN